MMWTFVFGCLTGALMTVLVVLLWAMLTVGRAADEGWPR
jgi:hypothetical protein